MKINPGMNEYTRSIQKNEKSQDTSKSKAAYDKKPIGDLKTSEAEISSKAKAMALAKQVADETPDVREDRVADLKAQISSGKYDVDADAIADRILGDHLSEFGLVSNR